MVKYLLDTDICVAFLKKQYGIADKIRTIGRSNIGVCNITIAELYYGGYKSGRQKHLQEVQGIVDLFEIIDPLESFSLYGKNKALLEKDGIRLEDFDLVIGSTAVYNNMKMVTGNVKHFSNIPDINIENWFPVKR